MSHLDRRRFLGLSLGSLASSSALPRWLAGAQGALPPGDRRLVVLELAGGNDGLNTLVPFEDDRYHRARPTLRLRPGELCRVDELNGLHGVLSSTRAWLDEGCVAIVRDVGYPAPSLSHFTSRDIWSTAALDPLRSGSGWLGRWAEREDRSELDVLALGSDAAPRLVRTPGRVPPAVPHLASFHFGAEDDAEGRARLEAFQALSAGPRADPELAYVVEAIALARSTSRRLAAAARTRRPVEYPSSALGQDLASVADAIAAGLPTRVFHVHQTGYDTHTKQRREHGKQLAQLDGALDAFLRDLRALGRLDDTLVLTTSEFGRRVAESGSGEEAGTDHGAASIQLLAGGRLRPGLLGAQPDLERLDADGNLVHRIDFRSVLATLLAGWLGAEDESLLGAAWPKLPLLETA